VDVAVAVELVGVDPGGQPRADGGRRLWLVGGWPGDRPRKSGTLHDVLRAWRAAERQLDGLDLASPYRALVDGEVAILRSTHHRLFEAIRRLANAQ
jgi:hypothetical protein